MVPRKYEISMEIAGKTAMWTRPDTGDSPISYPAPTYSAVKGIFESILWGPDIEIIPTRVEICSPIQYHSFATNYGGPLRGSSSIKNNTQHQVFSTVLIDVCYKLYASVRQNPNRHALPEKALNWDSNTTSPAHAYKAIFERRLKKGQSFHMPSLGLKEFTPTYFGKLRDSTHVDLSIQEITLPSMLREVFSEGYQSKVNYLYDNDVKIINGVLKYPERSNVNDK